MKLSIRSAPGHTVYQCGLAFHAAFETYDVSDTDAAWLKQYAGVVVKELASEPAPEAKPEPAVATKKSSKQ